MGVQPGTPNWGRRVAIQRPQSPAAQDLEASAAAAKERGATPANNGTRANGSKSGGGASRSVDSRGELGFRQPVALRVRRCC